VPARPPHEVALERLRALRARGGFAIDHYQPFHFEVAEVVRAYLGARYGFDSLELTTTELLDELRRVLLRVAAPAPAPAPIAPAPTDGAAPVAAIVDDARTVAVASPIPMAAIGDFLEECDLVKFAKAPSSEGAALRVLDMAETIVTATAAADLAPAAPAPKQVAHG